MSPEKPVERAEVTSRSGGGPRIETGSISRLVRRIKEDGSVRRAVFVFILTRILVLGILLIGGQISRVATTSPEGTREVFLSLAHIPSARIIRDTVQTADVNWYLGIAREGYRQMPFNTEMQRNWAFFPLFPLLWRLAAHLTGEYTLTGIVLSHIFFLFALIFVHKTAIAFGFSKTLTDRGLFYLGVFPTSYFFSLPLTESLFLVLTASCLYSAKRGWWLTAGVLGALTSATRVTGILILPAAAVLYWETFGGHWRKAQAWRSAILRKEIVSLVLMPAGLVAFMSYLYVVTGNPLAFKDILITWGRRTGFFLVTIFDYLRDPLMMAIPWDFRPLNFTAAMLALVSGILLLKWRHWVFGVYTLLSVLVALSSLVLQSQARYAMVLFPMYLVLAVAGERQRVDETVRTLSIVLLALMTALFGAHYTLAMS